MQSAKFRDGLNKWSYFCVRNQIRAQLKVYAKDDRPIFF